MSTNNKPQSPSNEAQNLKKQQQTKSAITQASNSTQTTLRSFLNSENKIKTIKIISEESSSKSKQRSTTQGAKSSHTNMTIHAQSDLPGQTFKQLKQKQTTKKLKSNRAQDNSSSDDDDNLSAADLFLNIVVSNLINKKTIGPLTPLELYELTRDDVKYLVEEIKKLFSQVAGTIEDNMDLHLIDILQCQEFRKLVDDKMCEFNDSAIDFEGFETKDIKFTYSCFEVEENEGENIFLNFYDENNNKINSFLVIPRRCHFRSIWGCDNYKNLTNSVSKYFVHQDKNNNQVPLTPTEMTKLCGSGFTKFLFTTEQNKKIKSFEETSAEILSTITTNGRLISQFRVELNWELIYSEIAKDEKNINILNLLAQDFPGKNGVEQVDVNWLHAMTSDYNIKLGMKETTDDNFVVVMEDISGIFEAAGLSEQTNQDGANEEVQQQQQPAEKKKEDSTPSKLDFKAAAAKKKKEDEAAKLKEIQKQVEQSNLFKKEPVQVAPNVLAYFETIEGHNGNIFLLSPGKDTSLEMLGKATEVLKNVEKNNALFAMPLYQDFTDAGSAIEHCTSAIFRNITLSARKAVLTWITNPQGIPKPHIVVQDPNVAFDKNTNRFFCPQDRRHKHTFHGDTIPTIHPVCEVGPNTKTFRFGAKQTTFQATYAGPLASLSVIYANVLKRDRKKAKVEKKSEDQAISDVQLITEHIDVTQEQFDAIYKIMLEETEKAKQFTFSRSEHFLTRANAEHLKRATIKIKLPAGTAKSVALKEMVHLSQQVCLKLQGCETQILAGGIRIFVPGPKEKMINNKEFLDDLKNSFPLIDYVKSDAPIYKPPRAWNLSNLHLVNIPGKKDLNKKKGGDKKEDADEEEDLLTEDKEKNNNNKQKNKPKKVLEPRHRHVNAGGGFFYTMEEWKDIAQQVGAKSIDENKTTNKHSIFIFETEILANTAATNTYVDSNSIEMFSVCAASIYIIQQ